MGNKLTYPNINLSDIKLGDDNYNKMKSEAMNGSVKDIHNMGMWNQTVKRNIDEAKCWYKKAADMDYEPSIEAYKEIENNEEINWLWRFV